MELWVTVAPSNSQQLNYEWQWCHLTVKNGSMSDSGGYYYGVLRTHLQTVCFQKRHNILFNRICFQLYECKNGRPKYWKIKKYQRVYYIDGITRFVKGVLRTFILPLFFFCSNSMSYLQILKHFRIFFSILLFFSILFIIPEYRYI